MSIDWMALVKVALVAFAFGVGTVTVFSVGIVGFARASRPGGDPSGRDAVTFGTSQPAGRAWAITLSALCFAGCAAAVLYGLYLIIPQFH